MILDKYINDLHILRTKLRRNKSLTPEENWQKNPVDLVGIEFQSWFDTTESEENSINQAKIDFDQKILKGLDLQNKFNSCEIGFGGGRLMNQASKHFECANGIDIHENFRATSEFLKRNNTENFNLFHFDERFDIPTIDLFYSFIVIQHFSSLKILQDYLDLIQMKLSDNGIAVLWYGKLSTPFWGNYYEVPSSKFRRRECSLFIHPSFMEKICSEFTIIEHQINNFKDPIKKIGHSMQSKIVIKKKKDF